MRAVLQTLLLISAVIAFTFYGTTIVLSHFERSAANSLNNRCIPLEDAEQANMRLQSRHLHELEAAKLACEESKRSVATNYKAICESRERKLLSEIQDAKEEALAASTEARRVRENPAIFGDLSQLSNHVQKTLLSLAKEVSFRHKQENHNSHNKQDNSDSSALFITETATKPPFFMSTLNPKNDKYIAPSLHKRGTWESHVLELMEEVIGDKCLPGKFKGKKPPLVIDVGANHGFFGLFAAAKGCRSALVEPQPDLVRHIHLSIAMNPDFAQRVRVYNNIINDPEHANTELYISMKDSNVGGRKVVNSSSCTEPGSCVPVKSITIDAISGDLPGNPEDVLFMKIDCEGYEPFAVRSARRLLSRPKNQRVPFIAMELYVPQIRGGVRAAKDTLHLLYDAGYFMQPIKGRTKSGWVRREKVDSFVDKWGNSFGDVLLVHSSVIATYMQRLPVKAPAPAPQKSTK